MWCPAATAFYGPGGGGSYIGSDTKLGGLVVMQLGGGAMDVPLIDRSVIYNSAWAYSMTEVYGSDMDGFSEGGFVWASQADVQLLIPRANLVGGMYRGNLTYGQLPSPGAVAAGQATPLTANQLLKISQDAELSDHFHLRSSVVNNNILYDSQSLGAGTVSDQQFASEVINYVILQTAGESITDGQSTNYSIMARLKGNGAFWQNPFDTFANNLFTNTQSSNMDPNPSMLAGVQPNHLNNVKNPTGGGGFLSKIGNIIKHSAKVAWDHKDMIIGGVEALGPLLLADAASGPAYEHENVLTAEYCRRLEQNIRLLTKLNTTASIECVQEIRTLFMKELQFQRQVRDRWTKPSKRMALAQLDVPKGEDEMPPKTETTSLMRSMKAKEADQEIRKIKSRQA